MPGFVPVGYLPQFPASVFSNYKIPLLFRFLETSIMENLAIAPVNPINITPFEPTLSIMDSYGPICFPDTLGFIDAIDIPPVESVSTALTESLWNGALTLPPAPQVPVGPRGAVMTRTLWQPGTQLKVGFQGGSSWQKVGVQTEHRKPESES